MTVRFQALLASLGVLWLVGQVAFMINAPAAPRQEYLSLIASVAMMSVASLAGLAIALTTNTRRPAGLDPAEHYQLVARGHTANTRRPAGLDPAEHYQLVARGHTASLAAHLTDPFGDTTAELMRPSVYLHGNIYGRHDEDDHKLVGELQKPAPTPPAVPAWAFAKAEQEGPPGLFQSSDQAAVYHQARPIDPLYLGV